MIPFIEIFWLGNCFYHGLRIILGWLDSAIRLRKRACNDVTSCQSDIGGPSVLCLTISRNAFVSHCIWLKNRISVVNRHLRFCPFPKKLGSVPCVGTYFNSEICRVGAMVKWIIRTHTRHISEFFGNGWKRRCLFIQIYDYLS